MLRKVIKVGSSAAVILPKEALEHAGVQVGDTVFISFEKSGRRSNAVARRPIDPEIIQWTDELIEEYLPLWQKLAKS